MRYLIGQRKRDLRRRTDITRDSRRLGITGCWVTTLLGDVRTWEATYARHSLQQSVQVSVGRLFTTASVARVFEILRT